MPAVAYLTRSPDGADMNGLLAEFDRRMAIALNGNSPLVPCVRGSSTGNNATLSALWTDMLNRTHDLLGYRFSFTDGSATYYHDLAAIQVGTWADYDHAALQTIAAAATPTSQDDALQIVTVTSDTDTEKLEGSLEAHRYEVSTGVLYWINVYGRPMRRHTYAVAELVCEGKTTLTVPREWDRFECYRVHNLSPADLVVTVEDASPTEVPHTFTVKPYGVKSFRRPKSGAFDDSLTYFWKFRVNSDRPSFLEASGITTANRSIPEQSARANPLARPFGILDWFAHFGLELDPRELPDQSSLFPNFHTPATASVFGDLIHFRGVVWSIAYPTETTLPAIIGKGQFNGYQTLVGDFVSIGIEATESGGVITLDRATNADGDAANGLDVFAPSSNILHDGAFGSFRTLPFDLESTAQLRWSATPFTAAVTTTTLTVKTLTDADPVTYSTDTATIPKLTVTPLRHSITHRARTLNVATLTTVDAHGFSVGQVVLVYGVGGSGYNGQVEVTVVPTTTTFKYASTGANEATATDSGSGYVQGQKTRAQLSDSAEPPTTSGVHWQGTWRLTPCGWRASWQYDVALTGPGLLEDFENASTDGLLDSIYDDITEAGIAIHRGMVAVVGQGWPMDDANTVFTAGEGNPHSLTPCHSREVRHQETDGTIGDHDPGFSGYTGTADGADLAKEDREADKYSGLKILAPLTFRRNPSTLAATHKLANITDSAHVPIIQEAVACDDPASIFAQRADLNTETAAVTEVDGTSAGTAFHYLPILPTHFNLLAYHVNAWTRCVPLCTATDVLLATVYDTSLFQDVYFTLSSIPGAATSYTVKGPSKFVTTTGDSFDYTATIEAAGVTVETDCDPDGAALITAANGATPTLFCVNRSWVLLDTLAPTPPATTYYGLVGQTFESITPPVITPSSGYTDLEQDIRDEIQGWIDEYTSWVSADAIKEWADDHQLVYHFERSGQPQVIASFDADANEVFLTDSVYATVSFGNTEVSWAPPGDWDDSLVDTPFEYYFCPAFVRMANPTGTETFFWLANSHDRAYLRTGSPSDYAWEVFDWATGQGGQDLDYEMASGKYVINLPDNPLGGAFGFSDSFVGPTTHFPSASYPIAGPVNILPGFMTDGRPEEVRAIDRGTFRTYAVVNVTSDPTGKLVSDSRLVAYRQYDVAFDSSWLFDSVDNATMGHHAIPRTLTDGDGSILTKRVAPNSVTILEPGDETGVWKVSRRLNVFFNLA